MTIWQDNVERFIQRRDETGDQIDTARAATIGTAIVLITHGDVGAAYYAMMRGLRRQWKLAGIGELQLGPEARPSEILEAWERAR